MPYKEVEKLPKYEWLKLINNVLIAYKEIEFLSTAFLYEQEAFL
jgi:hypothetical protein